MKLSIEEENLIKNLRIKKEADDWLPPDVNSIPDRGKIEAFDKLYTIALHIFLETKQSKYKDEDSDHWCFEKIMGLLGKDVWKHYNSFLKG